MGRADSLPPHGARLQRAELHDRHRGGAHDRRRRELGAGQRDRGPAPGRRRRRGQARAHGVRAGDRDEAGSPTRRAPASSCAPARARFVRWPRARGLAIGSAGTHPFALWEDQRIVARPRYRDLISALRFVARQELIFGHARPRRDRRSRQGDPRRQRHARAPAGAAGPERQLALLARRRDGIAVGAHADLPGLPACGDPALLRATGPTTSARSASWSTPASWRTTRTSGTTSGPTRGSGTVETRVCDSQTRVEHTLGLAALIQAMVKELAEHFDAGKPLSDYPWQMLDENKFLAARHGLDGELVDLPSSERVSTRAWPGACWTGCASTRRISARRPSSRASRTCSTRGNGAGRGRSSCTRPTTTSPRSWPRSWRPRPRAAIYLPGGVVVRPIIRLSMAQAPDLFVVCKKCGEEVSPYITECPYCGTRLRKRAPKIERDGTVSEPAPEVAPKRARRRPAPPRLGRLRAGEIPGVRGDATGPPVRDDRPRRRCRCSATCCSRLVDRGRRRPSSARSTASGGASPPRPSST